MRRPARLAAAGMSRPAAAVLLAAGLAAVLPAAASASTQAAATAGMHHVAGPATSAASTVRGTWRLLPKAPTKTPPYPGLMVAAWTGRQVIIHGIHFGAAAARGITLAYQPAASRWARLPDGPRPLLAQSGDAAVWTGSQLLVFGLTSGAYRPSANTWRPIARPPVTPSSITGWTGHQAITWQGVCCGNPVNSAEAYSPVTGKWRILRSPLARRTGAMGAWTGRLLIIAGGFDERNGTRVAIFRDGAAYNPATNSWRRLPPMPQPRGGGTAVWDGSEVLFLGGTAPGSAQPSLRGIAYNPRTNRWRLLPAMQFRRAGFAAVRAGHLVLVWGGQYRQAGTWVFPPHGEAYNPASNKWTALPPSPLHGRQDPAAVWTGRQLIVWGGFYVTQRGGRKILLDGATYTPAQ
jgi:hypothetical protein